MRRIIAISKLIRFPYLIIVALIMCCTRYLIVKPILGINDLSLQTPNYLFVLLVVAVLCLIAAGYAINDYFDIKYDRICCPKSTVIDRKIARISAIKLHSILNFIGIAIAIFVSYRIGVLKLSIFFVLLSGMLWFYSTSYKRSLIFGKVVVSLMIASIPLLVTIYEVPLLNKSYFNIISETHTSFSYLFNWVGGLSVFLFLVSFIMNLLKDSIRKSNIRELNIPLKVKIYLLLSYVLLTAFIITLIVYIFNGALFPRLILSLGIVLPSIIALIMLFNKLSVKGVKIIYFLIRLSAIIGVSFSIIIKYLFENNLI